MRYVNAVAEFFTIPDTLEQATLRWLAIVALIFPVVLADNYFHSSAPAGTFGYLLGSFTVWGTVRRMLKQSEAGRKALEERGG